VPAEIRLYNPLFSRAVPDIGDDFVAELNPLSLEVLTESLIEPALAAAKPGEPVQFERQGYFCCDPESKLGRFVFNRTVGLRDSWAKVRASGA
jgi:glutaminyl-tRNA synthetase